MRTIIKVQEQGLIPSYSSCCDFHAVWKPQWLFVCWHSSKIGEAVMSGAQSISPSQINTFWDLTALSVHEGKSQKVIAVFFSCGGSNHFSSSISLAHVWLQCKQSASISATVISHSDEFAAKLSHRPGTTPLWLLACSGLNALVWDMTLITHYSGDNWISGKFQWP